MKPASLSNGKQVSNTTHPPARKNGDQFPALKPDREQIARLACQFYIESGCQEGRDAENWLRAEQILSRQAAERAGPAAAKLRRKPEGGAEPLA